VLRHAATDFSKPDQDPVDLADCATQRNLSARGRADPVGFVNSVVSDFQGNPGRVRACARLPVISQCPLVADGGDGSPLAVAEFSTDQTLGSSGAKPSPGLVCSSRP